MNRKELEFDINLATPLEMKFKQGVGNKHNYVEFYDNEGVFVHKIKSNYTKMWDYNSKWGFEDAYVYANKIWFKKINWIKKRLVSYPIPTTSKYYNRKKRTILTEKV